MSDQQLARADVMVAVMARQIADGDLVGVGLGTPLAVAAALLARATSAPDAHVLVGGAMDPDADLATVLAGSRAVLRRTPGFVSHLDSMDMAERQAMTLQFLRPAEVDGRGNLNTSRIGPAAAPAVRFPGGLATGDVPALLPRVVAYLPRHRRRNLPPRVSCVTGAAAGWDADRFRARGVTLLVTDLAVIAFDERGATLRSVHPGVEVAAVLDATGFTIAVGDDVEVTPGPDALERAALARIDPDGVRARELRARPTTTDSDRGAPVDERSPQASTRSGS